MFSPLFPFDTQTLIDLKFPSSSVGKQQEVPMAVYIVTSQLKIKSVCVFW